MNWTFNCFTILILKSLEINIDELLGKKKAKSVEIRNLMRTLKYNFSSNYGVIKIVILL